MNRRRTPKGTYVGLAPEWFMDQAMGGRVFQAAVAAKVSYCELFNNSTAGLNLWVYGVICGTQSANELVMETYGGSKATASGFSGPLLTGGTTWPGLVGSHVETGCIGTEIGTLEGASSIESKWPYDWPCAVITPGNSFSVHTSNVNSSLSCGLWWLAMID